MRDKILDILEETSTLSAKEIGKKLGIHKSTVIYYLNKLGIKRDRNFIRKHNNTKRSFPIDISENAEQIILGSILGDGTISKHRRCENSKLNLNSKLAIKHSIVQNDYCIYKKELLEKEGIITHLTYIPPKKSILTINGREIVNKGSVEVSTCKNISFNKYRDLFYKNVKVIPQEIYKLKALGLAIWFMDDGSKHHKSYYLYTNCFSEQDLNILINMLDTNFGIKSTIHKSRNYRILYIKQESRDLFTSLIKDFICDSMKYKLHL